MDAPRRRVRAVAPRTAQPLSSNLSAPLAARTAEVESTVATLVIVSGAPASGKTTLARGIARSLALPMYSRDAIKEALFDTLGWRDRAWSRTLGGGSTRVLFELLGEALLAGADCLAEGTFRPSTTAADFADLLERTAARPVQVHCVADIPVLLDRFAARVTSGDRHPGHCDGASLEEFRRDLGRDAFTPLPVDGPTLIVDNTRPSAEQWAGVIAEVAALAGGPTDRAGGQPWQAWGHATGRTAADGDARAVGAE